ncbi:hypothetical protein B6S59_27665 [Pseudomonas sp. A46]|jgi:hypothetical protein|uniref:hypothetical protein n=1 Tax=Metapseudomonas furukawaii TaxID=1149133 RepID=UPI000B49D7F7|nr:MULTISPECIES: hypothetical protein [Pseudomonas]OWJ90590.1 hypothetical protein B6S59_27665 [Pseudomonas sp. A46]WAG77868.1 hypothetical protein LMK08_21265 [Pseudomonas furukawaii]
MARPRRILRISFSPLALTLSVALGVWLGFIAIGLTGYLGYRLYLAGGAPVAQVVPPPPAIATPAPAPPAVAPGSAEERLKRYEDNYNAAVRADNERVERLEEQRRLSNARCQFWTEQYRNAPTDRAKRSMEQACQ